MHYYRGRPQPADSRFFFAGPLVGGLFGGLIGGFAGAAIARPRPIFYGPRPYGFYGPYGPYPYYPYGYGGYGFPY
jgi:hypothetical protein